VKQTQRREVRSPEIKPKFDTEVTIETEKEESKILKVNRIPESTKNKALRFSLYSFRKDIIKPNIPPIISYVGQANILTEVKKGGGIDFNKYQKRKMDEVYGIKPIPSGADYSPKYDLVFKNYVNVEKYKQAEYNRKKYLLRKLWKNNNATTDFQIVKIE